MASHRSAAQVSQPSLPPGSTTALLYQQFDTARRWQGSRVDVLCLSPQETPARIVTSNPNTVYLTSDHLYNRRSPLVQQLPATAQV